jgi:hypothetical protein
VAGRGYGEGYGDGYEALEGVRGGALVTFKGIWVFRRISGGVTMWSVGMYMRLLRTLSYVYLKNGF